MEKQTLMIDMDEVITKGGFLYLINKFLGTNYVEDDFIDYYMQDIIPIDNREEWWEFFFSHNMYDYCEMLPHAREVIEELNEFYKVCIGTAYIIKEKPRESHILLSQKHIYLLDNLPYLGPLNFGFVNDKSFFGCDIGIDDKINNLETMKRKMLFTAYHNKRINNETLDQQNLERVDDWIKIKKLLLKK